MADYRPNPDQQQQQNIDPAGSTQMFRAFVDEGAADRGQPGAGQSTAHGRAERESGSKAGVIAGVVIAVLVIVAAGYFLLG